MANRVYGEFGLPQPKAARLPWVVAGLAFAIAVYGGACFYTTQSVAQQLHYQTALGEPLLAQAEHPFYAPWSIFRWRDQLVGSPEAQRLARVVDGQLELAMLVACFGAIALIALGPNRNRNRVGDLYGSERLANAKEIDKAQLFSSAGVVIGGYVDPKSGVVRWLRNNGFNHTAAYGPTGSGKGIALVIPTLLTWTHSIIVHDPKGENFARSSGFRATLGPVFRIDFAAPPELTAGFNPLDLIRVATLDEEADAQRLSREVVDPDGKQFQGKNKHWVEGAASLISGAVLHLVYKHRAQRLPPPGLYDVLLELTNEANIEAWKEFAHDPELDRQWCADGEETPTHPFVKNTAEEYLNRKGDEKASILSSAVTPLSLYRNQVLRANTSCSSFSVDELMDGDRPVSVYLVTRPEDKARTLPLTRIFLGMLIGRLTPPMEFGSGALTPQHTHRMLFLLDEFPMLGRMELIPSALAWMRGWGLTVYLLAQDYIQLTNEYGKDETISGGCEYITALRPNNLATAEMLSKRAGKTTATIVLPSVKLGGRPTYSQVGRDLLTPGEIMRLAKAEKHDTQVVRGGDMLIFGADRMIYGRQPLYFQDATLLARSQQKMAPAFPSGSPRPRPFDVGRAEAEAELIKQAISAVAACAAPAVPTVENDAPAAVEAAPFEDYAHFTHDQS